MSDIRRFIHIGYPKCASTTLQADFFTNHKQIYHLGAGIGSYTGYVDDDILIAAEVSLRTQKDFMYDARATKAAFDMHFKQAEKAGSYKIAGISSEHFSFTYASDIDVTQKAQRLYDIFGDNTTIIMITRNQMELLRALYGEHIREGYSGSYAEFLEYTYLFQDRNWYYDFCYDKMYDLYTGLFGKDNVKVIPFELMKESTDGYLKRLCQMLGVDHQEIELRKNNARMTPSAMEFMRKYNVKCKHTLENGYYRPFHLHRMGPYFQKVLKANIPDRAIMDFHLQMNLVNISNQLGKQAPNVEISMEYPQVFNDIFSQVYGNSNEKLMELTGLDLHKYNYPVSENVQAEKAKA